MQSPPQTPQEELEPPQQVILVRPPSRRVWRHTVLFLLTCLTTLIVGARMQQQFDSYQPMFLADSDFFPWHEMLAHPRRLLSGVPFAASLLAILFAHEMGHYLLTLRYRVYATLPFFLPAPTPIGTFGAFIQIRSQFRNRNELLDIAVGGPIAGFLVALPLAAWGLAMSKPLYLGSDAVMDLGFPAIFALLHAPMHHAGMFHGAPLGLLLLHPMAIAAWVGMLATSLNLLPGGQLDGGHIVFALSPKAHKRLTIVGALVLALASYFWWSGWIIWTVAFFVTRLHPPVVHRTQLSGSRKLLAFIALLLFLLTIIPVPFEAGGWREAWRAFSH